MINYSNINTIKDSYRYIKTMLKQTFCVTFTPVKVTQNVNYDLTKKRMRTNK